MTLRPLNNSYFAPYRMHGHYIVALQNKSVFNLILFLALRKARYSYIPSAVRETG